MLFNPVILVSRTLFIDGFGSVTVTHITTACALELVLRQPCRIVRAVKTDAPGSRQMRFDGGPAVLILPLCRELNQRCQPDTISGWAHDFPMGLLLCASEERTRLLPT